MNSLYDINREIYEALEASVDPETGEIGEAGLATLDGLQMERTVKVMHLVNYYNNMGSMIEAGRRELGRLQANVDRVARNQARLKNYVENNVQPGEQIRDPETDRLLISWRKSESTEITDEDAALAYCMEHYQAAVDVTPRLKKTELKKPLQDGIGIPGVKLVKKNNIQIK